MVPFGNKMCTKLPAQGFRDAAAFDELGRATLSSSLDRKAHDRARNPSRKDDTMEKRTFARLDGCIRS